MSRTRPAVFQGHHSKGSKFITNENVIARTTFGPVSPTNLDGIDEGLFQWIDKRQPCRSLPVVTKVAVDDIAAFSLLVVLPLRPLWTLHPQNQQSRFPNGSCQIRRLDDLRIGRQELLDNVGRRVLGSEGGRQHEGRNDAAELHKPDTDVLDPLYPAGRPPY